MPTIEKILDGFFFMNHIEILFGVLKLSGSYQPL